jgi:hypothetical protein
MSMNAEQQVNACVRRRFRASRERVFDASAAGPLRSSGLAQSLALTLRCPLGPPVPGG